MLQWIIQNSQILIILVVILGPILGKTAEWFMVQKAKRDQQVQRRRQEEEELRTGRPAKREPSPEEIEAMIAEQARQQHEAMQRQRAEQAEARRRAARERAEAARRRRDDADREGPVRPERGPQPQMSAPQKRPIREREIPKLTAKQKAALGGRERIAEAAAIKDIAPIEAAVAKARTTRTRSALPDQDLSPEGLRKAIVMMEVLGPPIAEREIGKRIF